MVSLLSSLLAELNSWWPIARHTNVTPLCVLGIAHVTYLAATKTVNFKCQPKAYDSYDHVHNAAAPFYRYFFAPKHPLFTLFVI